MLAVYQIPSHRTLVGDCDEYLVTLIASMSAWHGIATMPCRWTDRGAMNKEPPVEGSHSPTGGGGWGEYIGK